MNTLFISHSSHDDAVVREFQQALGDLKQDVWIDSRELRGGDPQRGNGVMNATPGPAGK